MRITVLFKYLSQKHTYTQNNNNKKHNEHFLVLGFFALLEEDTQHTHKNKENMYIYIFTKKEKEEKYKPGYETRTRDIIEVHLFLFFYYSFMVVDVVEYLLLITEGEDNVLYVELNVPVIIELLLVVNVQLNSR